MKQASTPEGKLFYVFDPNTGEYTETYTGNSNEVYATTDNEYDYNPQGQLTNMFTWAVNGTVLTSSAPDTTYQYDNNGNLTQEILPNGLTNTYQFDSMNRLTNVSEAVGSTVLFSANYSFNTAGLRSRDV